MPDIIKIMRRAARAATSRGIARLHNIITVAGLAALIICADGKNVKRLDAQSLPQSGKASDKPLRQAVYYGIVNQGNNLIAKTPRFADKVLIVVPPPPNLVLGFEDELARAAYQKLKNAPITNEQKTKIARDLSASVAAQLTLPQYHNGGFAISSTMRAKGDYLLFGTIADPHYLCAAVALRPETTQNFWFQKSFDRKTIKPDFRKNMPIEFWHRHIIFHEVGHCLHEAQSETGESAKVYSHRREMAADIFVALAALQNGEPDWRNRFRALMEFRRAEASAFRRLDHATAPALHRVITDAPRLRADPVFMRKPPDDLIAMADEYARNSIRENYPHLYVPGAYIEQEMLEMTRVIDDGLQGVVNYAYERSNGKGSSGKRFGPMNSILLAQTIVAANTIFAKPGNGLIQETPRLCRQPAVAKQIKDLCR